MIEKGAKMKLYDSDIRELLIVKFLNTKEYTLDSTTKIIHEMDVCSGLSRIDIAVINGKIHGYEIKSNQDTLERLPSQIESYNKIFDTMTLVTGVNHVEKAMQIIPDWWGVYYVSSDKKPVLRRKRQHKLNTTVDIFQLTQLLWKDEMINLLEYENIKKGIKSKSRFALGELIVSSIEVNKIKKYVRNTLKTRESWRAVQLQQLYDDLQQ
jgi:hypothetical protein